MNNDYTIGDWTTEEDSAAALDDALWRADLWTTYKEVRGTHTQPRPSQTERTLRIDRVLVPNQRLISLGWTHGVVGVEVKRSGVKIGPVIAQAMDYSRATWTLPKAMIKVWLDWVFIWPMERQTGTLASILAQQRIGIAYSNTWTALHLKTGESNLIKVGADGDVAIGEATNGQKVGSR